MWLGAWPTHLEDGGKIYLGFLLSHLLSSDELRVVSLISDDVNSAHYSARIRSQMAHSRKSSALDCTLGQSSGNYSSILRPEDLLQAGRLSESRTSDSSRDERHFAW